VKGILEMLTASAQGGRVARGRAGVRRLLRARSAAVLALVLGGLALTSTPALSATEGATTTSEAKANHAAQLAAEREGRVAKRRIEAHARRIQQIVQREEHAAQVRAQREAQQGLRITPHGFVEITCATVTWHFEHFSNAPHTVREIVSIDGERGQPVLFTFTGESGSNMTPVGASASSHAIDAFANWVDNGVRDNWDISAHRVCGTGGPGHSYTIEKRQKIFTSKSGFVTTPLSGEVGQTVEYQIVVTNTGSEFLDFSNFQDPHCDKGTIKGGVEGLLAPGSAATDSCTHVITPADQEAGSYLNTAEVTATPFGHQEPVTTPSNTVEVTVVPPGTKTKEKPPTGKEPSNGGGSNNPGTTTTTTASNSTLGQTSTQTGKGGTLASTASVPALQGSPHGCVRSSFIVSVKSKGVRAVTFYLDNHKIKKLTAKNARAGKLSVRVQTAHLSVGVHRVKARITMNSLTASTKAVIASRSMTFARCASAVISPRFTG
jgi:hypothetical protein